MPLSSVVFRKRPEDVLPQAMQVKRYVSPQGQVSVNPAPAPQIDRYIPQYTPQPAQLPSIKGIVGDFRPIFNATANVGKSLISAPVQLGHTINYPIIQSQMKGLLDSGQIKYDTYKEIVDEAAKKANIDIGDTGATLFRKTAAPVAMTTLDVLTAGLPNKLFSTIPKSAITSGAIGGTAGAINTLGEDKPTPQSLASNVASGVVGGAVLGGAVAGVPRGFAKVRAMEDRIKAQPGYRPSAGGTSPDLGDSTKIPKTGNIKYTGRVIDKAVSDFGAGKIDEKQLRALLTDHYQATYGKNPTEADLRGLAGGYLGGNNLLKLKEKFATQVAAKKAATPQANQIPTPKTKIFTDRIMTETRMPRLDMVKKMTPRVKVAYQSAAGEQLAGNTVGKLKSLEFANTFKGLAKNDGLRNNIDTLVNLEKGAYANTPAGEYLRGALDDAFGRLTASGYSPGYIQEYLPHVGLWKEGTKVVSEKLSAYMGTVPAAVRHRIVPTIDFGIKELGLTPKTKNPTKLYTAYIKSIEAAIGNAKAVQTLKGNGLALSEGAYVRALKSNPSLQSWGEVTMPGMKDIDGSRIYMPRELIDVYNKVLGANKGITAGGVEKLAQFNEGWQDIMLAGGLPLTPANFFTYANMFFRDLPAGKIIGSVRDFGVSFNPAKTSQVFLDNGRLLTDIAKRGTPINFAAPSTAPAHKNAWNSLFNQPTFGRWYSLRQLSIAKDIVAKVQKKGGSYDEAVKVASDTLKTFYGLHNALYSARPREVQAIISAIFFAPKYRESIINSLVNMGKSLNPATYGEMRYSLSRRWAAGLGAMYLLYNLAQKQVNGKYMFENEGSDKLSIVIPYGEPSDKGVQKIVKIPFGPSLLTIPRNIVEGTINLSQGKYQEAGRNLASPLASYLQVGGQALSNRDYFGRPIYVDQRESEMAGLPQDSGVDVLKKLGIYTIKQASHPYVRSAIDYMQDKPTEQVVAQALEMPVRFGKQYPEETTSYFKERDKAVKQLSPRELKTWQSIHPKANNDPTEFYSGVEKATAYIKENGDLTNIWRIDQQIATREGGKYPHDPLYDLPNNKAFVVLKLQQLQGTARNSAEVKQIKANNAAWLNDFNKKRSAYFDSQNLPEKERIMPAYEEASPQVQAKLDYYNKLDGTNKTAFLRANPDVTDYFAKSFDYTNLVRKMQGVPEFAKRPQPSPATQAKLDYYNTLPKGTGARSRFLRANPDVTQFFADLKFFNEAGPFGTGIAAGGGGANKDLAKIIDEVYGGGAYSGGRSYRSRSSRKPRVRKFTPSFGRGKSYKLAAPSVSVPRKIGRAKPIKIVAKYSKA